MERNIVLVIVAQLFGIITICLSFMSTKSETRKYILFYNSVANFTAGVQYALLGAWSGALCSILALARNLVFKRYEKVPVYVLLSYVLVLVVLNISTIHGFITIVPIINVAITAYALSQDNVVTIKLIGLFTGVSTLAYDIINWAFIGVLSALFSVFSSLYVLSILYKKYKAGEEFSDEPKNKQVINNKEELATA